MVLVRAFAGNRHIPAQIGSIFSHLLLALLSISPLFSMKISTIIAIAAVIIIFIVSIGPASCSLGLPVSSVASGSLHGQIDRLRFCPFLFFEKDFWNDGPVGGARVSWQLCTCQRNRPSWARLLQWLARSLTCKVERKIE